jgi:hypothetical protein
MYHFNLTWKKETKATATSKRLHAIEAQASQALTKKPRGRQAKELPSKLFPFIDFSKVESPLSYRHRRLTIEDVDRLPVGSSLVYVTSTSHGGLPGSLFSRVAAKGGKGTERSARPSNQCYR